MLYDYMKSNWPIAAAESFDDDFDSREELKWRLNQKVKGIDPGQPFNWFGLR